MEEEPYGPTAIPPIVAVSGPRGFARRAAVLAVLLGIAAIVWYTAKVFLLAFAGVLLAVFLDALACKLAAAVKIRRGWAFAIVTIGIAFLLIAAGWTALPRVADQVTQLLHSIPSSLERLQAYLAGREWGRMVSRYIPDILASSNITARISGILGQTFYGIAGIIVVIVIGIYLGANPAFYRRGVVSLFPPRHRDRALEALNEVGYTLRWWIIGQLIPMAVLGIATTIGLKLLHVRLAFTLGLFTAFMIFIPYIGSMIAFVVTLLATLIQGATVVLYVTILFLGVHTAEGYLLTPLVQRRAVYLPPALTIVSQVLLGLLLGFLGLALATPLTAAVLVLVRMLYLHQRPRHHDQS